MSSVTPSGSSIVYGGAGRRLATGLLLSLLAHALVLTLQFGVPGFGPGQPAPLRVVLAPAVPVTVAPADPVALSRPTPAPAPPPPAPAVSGLRLVDRAPEPDPPPQPRAPAPAAAKRVRPRRAGAARAPEPPPVPVIASESGEAAAFAMPSPPQGADAGTDPLPIHEDGEAGEDGVAVTEEPGADGLADEGQQEAQVQAGLAAEALREREEQARLAHVREQEEAHAAAEALALAQQRAADQERLPARQHEAARERERILAQQLLADQQREQETREAAVALAARRQAEDEAIRREAEATAARQRAGQLAVQQAQEEQARRQAAEAARQLAQEELARRQAAEAARQLAQEAAREAQDAARREANEAARLGAEQAAARRQPTPGTGGGDDPFAEGAGGALPTGPGGSGLAGRARELVRGLQIPGAVPHVLRPAAEARAGRRIVVAGNERDVPLRMYVDSFRQKIERNTALHMPDRVRIDPLVSVSLHSDGSVGEVIILRSSGRPDVDQAVMRTVRLNARYSVFPAHLAAKYDVIEIRRIWSFAEGLKLLEEMR